MEQVLLPGWHISSSQLLEKVQTRRRLGNHGVHVFRPLKVAGDMDTQQLEYWYSKVKGQFRYRDLLRDGAICVIHRHI